MDALAHADEAERAGVARLLAADPASVVADADHEPATRLLEPDLHARRTRVAGDVRERLLDDAEHGDRAIGVERGVVAADAQPAADSRPRLELARLPLERRGEADVVEERRPEVPRDRLYAVDGAVHQRCHALHLLDLRGSGRLEPAAEPVEVDPERGERLAELVVDLARDPATLVLLDLEAPRRERPQLGLRLA